MPARVWRGTAWQVLGRVVGAGTTALTLVVLARLLAPAEFGRYTFYIAVFAVLDALADFGTGQVVVQRTAGNSWALPGALRVARRIRLGFGVLGVALVSAMVVVQDEPGGMWIALAALYPCTHALELSVIVFRNDIDWAKPTAVRIGAATARTALVLGLAFGGERSAAVLIFATALGSSSANFLLHAVSRARLPRPTIAVADARGLLRDALPLGAAGLCQQAYFYVDNLFVRGLLGEEPLARYNAGVRLMSFLIMVAQYAGIAALPWLVRERAKGPIGPAVARLGQPMFLAACAGTGLLVPHSAEILRLIFDEGFEVGGPALAWLLAAVATVYAGAALLTAVVALGRTRDVLVIAGAGLVLNIALNAVLVPRLGIEGSGLATFATELLVALLSLAALARAGARPLASRPWLWLGGPALFALAALASGSIG